MSGVKLLVLAGVISLFCALLNIGNLSTAALFAVAALGMFAGALNFHYAEKGKQAKPTDNPPPKDQ